MPTTADITVTPIEQYISLLQRLEQVRHEHDEAAEESILSDMDDVWDLLSDDERASINNASKL